MTTGFGMAPRWLRDYVTAGELNIYDLGVYLALSWRVDEDASAFPSHQLLADEAGCSVASVRRSLGRLGRLGIVTVTHRHSDKTGGQTSNRYRLAVHRPRQDDVAETAPPALTDHPPCSEGAPPLLSQSNEREPDEREPDEGGGRVSAHPHQGAAIASSPARDEYGPLWPTCSRHRDDPSPPPCGMCATWREEYLAAEVKRAQARDRQRSAEAIQRARQEKGLAETPKALAAREAALPAARQAVKAVQARHTAARPVRGRTPGREEAQHDHDDTIPDGDGAPSARRGAGGPR